MGGLVLPLRGGGGELGGAKGALSNRMGRSSTPTAREVRSTAELVVALKIAREAARKVAELREEQGWQDLEVKYVVQEFREVLERTIRGRSAVRVSSPPRGSGSGGSGCSRVLQNVGEFPDSPEESRAEPPVAPREDSLPRGGSGRLVDEWGNALEAGGTYVLLKSVPGTAKPGIYQCSWKNLLAKLGVDKYPSKGFFINKVTSEEKALELWKKQGHRGELKWIEVDPRFGW